MSIKYSIDEVFNLLGEDTLKETGTLIKSDSIEFNGYQIYKDS